jgi:anti-sigma regulatory factor (Ser/Thr protein kinase)
VTFAWPTPMTTDPSHIELRVPNDKRLTSAIETVLVHAGERAGLSHLEQKELTHSTAEACDEAFATAARNGNSNPMVRVTVSDFPNRVEVSIEGFHDSQPDGCEMAASAEAPDPVTAALEQMNVDRVHHEFREGRPRTVLVKHRAGGITHH